MAIAFVQKIEGKAGPVNSISLIFSSNNTAGNFISVGAGWYETLGTVAGVSVTDTRNTYTLDEGNENNTSLVGLWSAQNIGSGANTVVINPVGTDAYIVAVASEWSGIETTSAKDVSTGEDGSDNTPSSGTTATTTRATTLTVAALSITSNSTNIGIDLPSGYTNLTISQNAAADQGVSVDYRINSSAGTQSASWGTIADTGVPTSAVIVAYKGVEAGGVTGSLARTNINDSLAAAGTTTILGSLNRTNTADTSSASGTTTIVGTLSRTNNNDTVVSSGSPIIVGTINRTNTSDTIASSGSVGAAVEGTINYTNSSDNSIAAGNTTILGTGAITNIGDTCNATGSPVILASGVTLNANDTIVASGTSSTDGTVNTTNGNDTLAGVGVTTIVSAATIVNAGDICVGMGSITILGSLNKTNTNDTMNAFGIVGNAPIAENRYRWLGLVLHRLGM